MIFRHDIESSFQKSSGYRNAYTLGKISIYYKGRTRDLDMTSYTSEITSGDLNSVQVILGSTTSEKIFISVKVRVYAGGPYPINTLFQVIEGDLTDEEYTVNHSLLSFKYIEDYLWYNLKINPIAGRKFEVQGRLLPELEAKIMIHKIKEDCSEN